MSERTHPVTAEDYDSLPYRSMPYAFTRPEVLAAVAHLFGVGAPDPRGARMLEIGCAAGGNLIPLAARFPGARFLGIDFSRGQVAAGQARIREAGLDNVEIRYGDVAEVDLEGEVFDYVVAHGVWSWVPPAAREAILAIAGRQLSPQGVAYVSYNVYPGWNMRRTVRDLCLYHAGTEGAPDHRVARARWMLEKLGQLTAGDSPYGQVFAREAELNAKQPDSYILGEFLADHNHPCYFHEFLSQATPHGLTFLSEVNPHESLPDSQPPETAALLREIAGGSGLAIEQYMDFFAGRQFRRSLLVRQEALPGGHRRLNLGALHDLHLAGDWRRGEDGGQGVPWSFGRTRLTTGSPLMSRLLELLAEAWPASRPMADMMRQLAGEGLLQGPDDMAKTFAAVLNMMAAGGAGMTRIPVQAGRAADPRPQVSRHTRAELHAGQGWLTNCHHSAISVPPEMTGLVDLVDGTRDSAGLERDLAARVPGLPDPAGARTRLLQMLERAGLLVPDAG